jgi:hypothetical protein
LVDPHLKSDAWVVGGAGKTFCQQTVLESWNCPQGCCGDPSCPVSVAVLVICEFVGNCAGG